MPEIGEIKQGREIGQGQLYNYFVWQACESCGKKRWVRLIKDRARCSLCKLCQLRIVQTNNNGDGNGNWNGGKRISHEGYVDIWISDDDFFASMKTNPCYVREHRYVMAKSLGRCLHSWEIVHHKNHIKDDNRIENLQLVTDDRHKQITILEKRINTLELRVNYLLADNALLRKQNASLSRN